MYKIAVIGDRESVLGFKAVGLSVFGVDDPAEAAKILHRCADDEYAIIYITENIAKDILDEIDQYKEVRIPAITPIPGTAGSLGIGMSKVKKSVERAVGADILFGDE